MSNSTLRINCYVRIIKHGLKETGYVGRLGSIYRDEDTRRRSFGVDWASEYQYDELERITPAEYHATAEHLKLSKGWQDRHKPKYQIYVDRHDGMGLCLDGCWGSEHARFDDLKAAEEAAEQLETVYPDCEFVVEEVK